jgi:hypothetical protein
MSTHFPRRDVFRLPRRDVSQGRLCQRFSGACGMPAVQVVESAKANGTNNHGLDGNRLFVGALISVELLLMAERK